MTKRPAIQFYWTDWLRHIGLLTCSLEAQGLAIRMFCLMCGGDPFGTLCINGKAISDTALARMVGVTVTECKRLVEELLGAGVYARDDTGVIISRRMIRDDEIRLARAQGGHKSVEHPTVAARLKPPKDNLPATLPHVSEDGIEGAKAESFGPPPSSSIFSLQSSVSPRARRCVA